MLELEGLLERKEKGQGLFSLYSNNIGKIKELLKDATLPFYTTHGIDHSESVIFKLDQLIPDKMKEEMNEVELFTLLSSAYFHDIGMAIAFDEKDRRTTYKKEEEYTKRLDFIRRTHSERAYRFISSEKNIEKYGFDKGTASVIAMICRAHSDNKYNKEDTYADVPTDYKGGGIEYTYQDILKDTSKKAVDKYTVRIHLLAALFRLADELDVSYKRADKNINERRELPPQSEREHKKNLLVRGVDIDTPKREIVVGVFEGELYKGGIVGATNNQLITEVIIKLRKTLLEVQKTLFENDLRYNEVKFRDIVVRNLQDTLKKFGIARNTQPIYDDKKYSGALLYRFYYNLEKLYLSPEYIISNDIDFLFLDSNNLMENCDAIFLRFAYNSSSTVNIEPLKFDILGHLNQISCSSLSEAEIENPDELSANYMTVIKNIPEELLKANIEIIRENIPKIVKKWDNRILKGNYYLEGIEREISGNIIKDVYSYLRRENLKKKCQDHFIYVVFSETYFLNIIKARIPGKTASAILEEKITAMSKFIKDKKNENIKFYYHAKNLDAESKLISSELAYENSITNDSVIVINNTNVVVDYYKKNIDFLTHKNTWKIKSINPKKMIIKFDDGNEDEYYQEEKKYKDKFRRKAELEISELLNSIRGDRG